MRTFNGRPVAPQFETMKTDAEYKKFMAETEAGARYSADEFMRLGKSKWIARSLQEGWPHLLRHLAYQLARKDMLEYGEFPSLDRLNQLTINKDDHDRLKFVGRKAA